MLPCESWNPSAVALTAFFNCSITFSWSHRPWPGPRFSRPTCGLLGATLNDGPQAIHPFRICDHALVSEQSASPIYFDGSAVSSASPFALSATRASTCSITLWSFARSMGVTGGRVSSTMRFSSSWNWSVRFIMPYRNTNQNSCQWGYSRPVVFFRG